MSTERFFYADAATVHDARGRSFLPGEIRFGDETRAIDPSWDKLSPRDAVKRLQSTAGRIRPPVGVIGPRSATEKEYGAACALGRELADAGLSVICGGRQGVMEAVCKGVAERGGVSIGLLPEGDWKTGNPHVGVPVATGIGIARNALIACSAHVLVAVGAGLGTMSEMALGLQFGKRVFCLFGGEVVPGVEAFDSWEEMADTFYSAVLNA